MYRQDDRLCIRCRHALTIHQHPVSGSGENLLADPTISSCLTGSKAPRGAFSLEIPLYFMFHYSTSFTKLQVDFADCTFPSSDLCKSYKSKQILLSVEFYRENHSSSAASSSAGSPSAFSSSSADVSVGVVSSGMICGAVSAAGVSGTADASASAVTMKPLELVPQMV